MKTILSFATLLGLLGAGSYYYLAYYRHPAGPNFRTAPVERGSMLPTIEATGSLEPEQVVDIGSQVNGLITDLKVDYGSPVEKDTVLATIDQKSYQATVDQYKAAIDLSKANLKLSQANQVLAQANLNRDTELLQTKGALAPNQYDADFAALQVAKATVGVQQASIKQAEATLRQAQINLDYCSIVSPVKGTIVDRRVNVGQDVVSSLSASSLFLLAKDLSRIQVWASVNEADIGRIHPGMKVHFKVDAYPNESFPGVVSQIRLNATMTQNVVTYTVVVTTDNPQVEPLPNTTGNVDSRVNSGPQYKLLPYMTASLQFEIEDHENVLKVPNAALRWKPRPNQIARDVRAATLAAMSRHDDKSKAADDNKHETAKGSGKPAGSATGLKPEDWKARAEKRGRREGKPAVSGPAAAGGKQSPPQQAAAAPKAQEEHHESGRLWIVDGNFVRPIPVKIIATDGTMTEVRIREHRKAKETDGSATEADGQELREGTEVVIGESIATDADSDTTNPFMPRLHGPSKSSGSGSSGK